MNDYIQFIPDEESARVAGVGSDYFGPGWYFLFDGEYDDETVHIWCGPFESKAEASESSK